MRLPLRGPAAAPVSGLSGDERGLARLYARVLRLRDVLLVVLAVLALALPGDDPRHLLVAGALLVVVLPYNLALGVLFRRRGRVVGAMAWGDQVLAASFVAVLPELIAPALVVALLDVAVAAVLLDRRAALHGALAGAACTAAALGTVAALGGAVPPEHLLAVAAYGLSAVITAETVGTVAWRERRGQQQLTALLQSLPVVVYEMDAETLEVRYVSPHISRLTGRPAEDFLGDPSAFLGLVHRRDQTALLTMVSDLSEGRRTHDLAYRVITADGTRLWVRNTATTEVAPDGRRLLRGSISDITAQKEAEAALERQARTDALTGLPNRAALLHHLERAPELGVPHLLVFLDVDAFKRINDSIGHAAGDALLVQVAARLPQALRADDHVARIGGDEFVVLAGLVDAADAAAVVQRVQDVFAAPFDLDGRSVRVTASAGARVVEPGEREPAEVLLQGADAAMYAAKRTGPGRVSFWDAQLRATALERLDLEGELRTALAQGQFSLVYQPVVRAGDRVVVGHEALVRWRHPERGLVSPAGFVPVAEQTGQIVDIGRWVLSEACAQARRWRDATGQAQRMSVNLSALQLSDPHLVDDVTAALTAAGLPADALALEVTETALIENPQAALAALRELRARGVTIALDDFGTGYSSLSHLHTYPVDVVKVDRSFVARMNEDAAHSIVTAVLHLAEHMGLAVVAEGVETLEQADALAALGCDLLQGYALGRPEPAAAALLPHPREGRVAVTRP